MGMRRAFWLGLVVLVLTLAVGLPQAIAEVNPMNESPPPGAPLSPGAIISNGTIQLGVVDQGQLNEPGGTASMCGVTTVGLRYLPNNVESTSPGCLCEGWGVADGISGVFGYADQSAGVVNVTDVSFGSDATTAISVVTVGGDFQITHDFFPSASPFLYECVVTIENISGGDLADVRYTRQMDWDTEPTFFSEFVTIQGTAAAANVLYADDNAFQVPSPLAPRAPILATGDFVDSGPEDHGALFDFGFGALADGESMTFSIFYGAAPSEGDALAALASVSAEVYSFGQIDWDGTGDPLSACFGAPGGTYGATSGEPHTFIFGFAGVGGTALGGAIPTTSRTGVVILVLLMSGAAVLVLRRRFL